jgi:hypothetical protein
VIAFLIHTVFICFIGTVVFGLVEIHEHNARMANLLKLLVVMAGSATIINRLLFVLGVGL